MTNYLLQEYCFKLKLIGIYQIVGGLAGLGLTTWLITMLLPMPFIIACVIIVAIGFFTFSISCGLGLWFKKKIAINLSIGLHLMQIITFTLFGCSFKSLSGLGVFLNFNFPNNLQIQLSEPLFRFTYLADPTEKMVGINLVSIIVVFFIVNLKKKINGLLNNQNEKLESEM